MDGFPVRKQNDPQIPPAHFRNGCPAANPAILLNNFILRVVDDMLNPFLLDDGTIRTLTHGMKVLGEFHRQQSTRRSNFVKSVGQPDLVHLSLFWFKPDNNTTYLHVPYPQVITNWKADLTPSPSTICRAAFARE